MTTKQQPFIPQTLIGADTFSRLVERSTVIVDKTLLIKEFLENPNTVNLITYPRRWGKTINMDMIKTFLELEVDKEGKELPTEQKCNITIFASGKWQDGKQVPLQVWQEQCLIEQYFGKYPVIYISFKDIRGNDYKELVLEVQKQVRKLYEYHQYLLKSDFLTIVQKKQINRYIASKANISDLKESLSFLSELLYIHFKKQVFILIDEYDTPINHANLEFEGAKERKRVTELFRGILGGALKGNNYMEKSLVTGILRIAKVDLFSGVNNFEEYNVLDREYAPYYGFTESEMEDLLNKYNVKQDLRDAMKNWYNGYKAGSFEIYNPWSILRCLSKIQKYTDEVDVDVKTEILRSYWEESGNVDFLSELLREPQVKAKITDLIEGRPVYFNLKRQITIRDFDILRLLISKKGCTDIRQPAIDLLLSYLFLSGYLTILSDNKYFRLPNNEVRQEFGYKLLEYYEELYNIDPGLFAIVTGNIEKILRNKLNSDNQGLINEFKISLQALIEQFPTLEQIREKDIKIKDNTQLAMHANEDIIHGALTYVVLQVRTASILGSEMYLGKGRADLVLVDKVNKKAALLELKYNKSADEGLKQIKEKEYAKKLQEDFEVILIGINILPDKQVEVKYEIVAREA